MPHPHQSRPARDLRQPGDVPGGGEVVLRAGGRRAARTSLPETSAEEGRLVRTERRLVLPTHTNTWFPRMSGVFRYLIIVNARFHFFMAWLAWFVKTAYCSNVEGGIGERKGTARTSLQSGVVHDLLAVGPARPKRFLRGTQLRLLTISDQNLRLFGRTDSRPDPQGYRFGPRTWRARGGDCSPHAYQPLKAQVCVSWFACSRRLVV